MDPDVAAFIRATKLARVFPRHCERSEAIHRAAEKKNGLLRCARNDAAILVAAALITAELAARRIAAVDHKSVSGQGPTVVVS
jgi:hypothetical protein